MYSDGRKIVIKPELQTKSFERQIEYLLDKIEDLQLQLKHLEPNSEEFQKVSVELEKAKNTLGGLIDKQKELNQTTSKIDFRKWTKQLTKVGFALFSIRGVMGVIRKASSTYLSQNETTAQKLQALWTALGNIVGPVLEMIADAVLKLIGYLNIFVKTLSAGKIDLTKNMNLNTKAINGTSKAMKELNKQTASFDEMNILQDQSSSLGGVGGVSSAFSMPELNPRIVSFLENLAQKLRDNWDLIKKVGAAFLIVFGAARIAGILKNIGLLMGSEATGTGLLGLSGILNTLATIGVIVIGVSLIYTALTGRRLIDDLAQIKTSYDELKEAQKAYEEASKTNRAQELIDKYNKLSKETDNVEETTKDYIKQLFKLIDSNKEENKQLKTQLTLIGELNGNNKIVRSSMENLNSEYNTAITELTKLAEQEELDKKQKESLVKMLETEMRTLEEQNRHLDKSSEKYKDNYNKINDLKSSLENITDKTYKVNVEIPEPKTSGFKKAINGLFEGIETALRGGLHWNVKLPRLAKGGIVNMPGKGVPIGGAIAGEYGREAVLPLQDSAVLDEIADAIGRRVVINATIPVSMNGRILSREIQKVQGQSDFAMNR